MPILRKRSLVVDTQINGNSSATQNAIAKIQLKQGRKCGKCGR